MRWQVVHTTTYRYDAPVTDSVGRAHLTPLRAPWQRVGGWDVAVDPAPADRSDALDAFGNATTYFQVTAPHRTLRVEARGEVEVLARPHDAAALATPWERLRPVVEPGRPGAWAATEHALASAHASGHEAGVHAYAAGSLTPGRPVGEAVGDLVARLHADLAYDPAATTVTSTVVDVLASRAGVCQDFAHLALACLRSHGLAARYVSGYLATEPPPGRERVVGADASHAWLEVWLGEDAWWALDPTNDQQVGERYVTLARGRDYGDVAPVRGVIVTEAGTSVLEVAVDVAPLPDPPVPLVPPAPPPG